VAMSVNASARLTGVSSHRSQRADLSVSVYLRSRSDETAGVDKLLKLKLII